MKRYHEEQARIQSEQRFHLRYVHNWPKRPIDCECELQAGRFRKKKGLDCGKAACRVCHYEKILGIASYKDRVRLLRAKDSVADYFENFE
ncbi:MAG TPA: hypothetical protein VLM38_20060 [Blastocatellia bacterium]|nr:hypothetical protein [Blastocatellia bacterium]